MNFQELIKSKKFKNMILTLVEVLVVAGFIFGVLMYIQNKVDREADITSGLSNKVNNENTTTAVNKYADKYCIEVNLKKSAIIIYQYSKDKKEKKPYKVFNASIGSDVKKGKFKTSNTYSWIKINGYWHKYNTKFGGKSFFQTVNYTENYDNTVKADSYKKIGKKQKAGKCILLAARDAYFIKTKCGSGTEVTIVKGKNTDILPLNFEINTELAGKCRWEPTDPDKNNPYLKKAAGTIVAGVSTVYIEKGHKINYLNNIIALDEDGKDLTSKLKYKKFKADQLGKKTVKYTLKTKSGKKVTFNQKFKVIDTTPPKVSCSKVLFEFEVKSLDQNDLNTKKNVKKIVSMVQLAASCNESNAVIDVSTVEPEQLNEGKIPVTIKAKDSSGNVGNLTVFVEIKAKKGEKVTKYRPKKAEKTTKKKKKKKSKKTEETTKGTGKKNAETTKQSASEQAPTAVNE